MKEALSQVEVVERLDGIAKRIRTHHDEAMAAGHLFRSGAEQLRAANLLCGQALLEAKGLMPHGKWIEWVRVHCGFSHATATRYMAGAKPNCAEVSNLERVKRFTYALLSRWAQRVPKAEVVLSWPVDEQRRALAELEPTERLCVALRERIGGVGAPDGVVSAPFTPARSAVSPPDKESI